MEQKDHEEMGKEYKPKLEEIQKKISGLKTEKSIEKLMNVIDNQMSK